MAEPAVRQQYADVAQAAETHNLTYPLTAINGELKFAGGISYYTILNILRELLGEPQGQPAKA